ncbi:sugar phosphate isomerase/epimerase family protein [Rhodococcus opacus]|uniref:sugar phosphate isomerase/epimerase family protein n=1 Tax=Rhodococcus opacus TaxID=37919 RepID=UPI000EA90AAD|nr:sugar phosphate isomerase/epimerase [Rhodococcus opacus]QZS57070.1 sugar phosphate isomerase/epimerase [Rhodococcus opacus]RKM76298.1 sugar phosphate isomerase [Rhodococcus opacus]
MDEGAVVKLGMLTACLPGDSLTDIAHYAATAGYHALEVAAWPSTGSRDFEAAHLDLRDFSRDAAQEVAGTVASLGLEISALAFYENNLHPDPRRRDEILSHLRTVIDAAELLGVPYVGTFIGRDWTRTVSENLSEGERILPELVSYAADRGVRLIIENCVMEGWHPDGYPGNLAYSPELWEWMFDLGFYLNWDPSHLTWIGIDPVRTIAPYIDRIVHAQAKDIQILDRAVDHYGFFGKIRGRQDPWDTGWWRYRVPGRGQVDWTAVVDELYSCGYAGVLSVEHEDPVWGGSPDKVREGLDIACHTLTPLIYPGGARGRSAEATRHNNREV